MAATAESLGPFAPEQGPASTAATAGAAFGVAALATALAALILDVAGAASFRSRPVAVPLAVAGVAASLAGFYSVGVGGRSGRRLASAGLAAAALGGLIAYAHTAVMDGSLHLDRFGAAYFDREIISAIWPDLLRAVVNTLKLAVLAEILGIIIGLVVATMEISHRGWLRIPAIAYVDVVRGLPLLMLLLLINYGLPYLGITLPTVVSAVAALTINASAYIAEIFRAGIQSIDRGQTDAARSLGMPHATAMLFVVIPQAVRRVIPPLTSEFIALVKDTSLVSIIGATVASRELLQAARSSASSTFSPTPFMAASIVYLAITLPLTRVVSLLERRFNISLDRRHTDVSVTT
jgi:His/Glu/Gln/Arg/opine family amino acid ABC transporter permease subunit